MLKKQTVWLLTMLSLVVVLSVYYVTAPKNMNNSPAFTANQKTEKTTDQPSVAVEEAKKPSASGETGDDLFTALRMKIEDERSRLRDELNAIVASANATAEEKNEALDKIEKLQALSEKEATLETLIKSKGGYEDVLVRADDNQVRVTIKAKQSSAKSANEVIHMVKKEIPDAEYVTVEFQPAG
ncbi:MULTISPECIES: SpoIIIAH-like family protein [Geobacillus]|uniref:Stage III sporulation protein AH n=1 Tax=Geobacillus thermocatenulatus TaxID=33938 RepID=A0A226QBF6_9BACL|nr:MULTISPECIES: SpoIIIAH-like family protein [Geobacillus]ASS98899.1 stage III sporulation protein AH [Geobacillus thermocatenulatus]KLR73636.1 stage III sporulation protein AH [Geobacillus sp. T6]OXB89655.1 stage III sporulation protein AH [Geobacillus thermocatenulatus]RAN22801.1 stage III sporulation protein AH [Geobacillus sp. A8]